MKKNNQTIKCDVTSCAFNNSKKNFCDLEEIKVSSKETCDCDTKKDTICDSFEAKDNE